MVNGSVETRRPIPPRVVLVNATGNMLDVEGSRDREPGGSPLPLAATPREPPPLAAVYNGMETVDGTNWGHVTVISAGWALWAGAWLGAYCLFFAPG